MSRDGWLYWQARLGGGVSRDEREGGGDLDHLYTWWRGGGKAGGRHELGRCGTNCRARRTADHETIATRETLLTFWVEDLMRPIEWEKEKDAERLLTGFRGYTARRRGNERGKGRAGRGGKRRLVQKGVCDQNDDTRSGKVRVQDTGSRTLPHLTRGKRETRLPRQPVQPILVHTHPKGGQVLLWWISVDSAENK